MGEARKRRAKWYAEDMIARAVNDEVVERIEDYRFRKLVGAGIVVPEDLPPRRQMRLENVT